MKISLWVALIFLVPMAVMAQGFTPMQLILSAPASVFYAFDGTELSIPVTVSGPSARITFAVFTKGKADQITRVQNGYIGWHYVDGIDTCVYFSPAYDFAPGTSNLVWSGQTHNAYLQEGNSGPVGPDNYTYYLWGYDYASPRIMASPPIASCMGQQTLIVDQAPDGTPLSQPLVIGTCSVNPDGDGPLSYPWETHFKWVLGQEPLNVDLVETCFLGDDVSGTWAQFTGTSTWTNLAFDDATFQTCYRKLESKANQRAAVWKMQWVSNGNAIKDETWGPDLTWGAPIHRGSGMSTDGTYLYTFTGDLFNKLEMACHAYIIDKATGEMLYNFFHEDFTDFEQYGSGADYLNAGALDYHQVRNGLIYGGNFICMKEALDPIRYMETEDYTDFKRWVNKNGDWVSDTNWQETALYKWACFGESAPKNRSFDPDRLGWVINMVGQYGAVTFSLFAPDGTGIGYFALQGEAEHANGTAQVCDAGSAYDGMYTDQMGGLGLYYTAWDNFSGTISNVPLSVADATPAAFAVAQNSPNPFNPTTTINFTIPEAGLVNVDVFNVAGQKVQTLVNNTMEAGNHTVTFDGANLAAGVYFYTVKAGEFSKTMKMTLLK